MKTKTDFVTNSSSTCYICFIPDNFELKENELERRLKELFLDPKEATDFFNNIEFTENLINKMINDLKEGKEVSVDNVGIIFYILKSLVNKFIIKEVDYYGGGSGVDMLSGVKNGNIFNIITEYIVPNLDNENES